MMSIRQRLLVLLVGLWVSVWLAVALITLDRSGHEVGELLDARLAQTAHVLHHLAMAGHLGDLATPKQTLSPIGHPYESKVSFQLWEGDRLVSTFGGAPETPLGRGPGFSDQDIGGTRWRVFGLPTTRSGELLFVAQSYSIRQELIHFLTIHALEPVLWSLPLTVLVIWLAVTDGLRPMRQLARDIGQRSSDRLEPVDEGMVPADIRPLIVALNGLMERLDQALERERHFAADASHELRTPLAVIRTHAQVAQRARDPHERDEAIAEVLAGVDRAAHLVSQLLVLLRVTPQVLAGPTRSDSLVRAVEQVLQDQRARARAGSIDLVPELPPQDPCVVAVEGAALEILVANLVDNAIKYSPSGGRVRIAVDRDGTEVRLRVADEGPGISPADRQRVFDRFYRPAGQDVPGSGLGLSIVQRICDQHGARIALLDADSRETDGPGSGLVVEVRFPTGIGRAPTRETRVANPEIRLPS